MPDASERWKYVITFDIMKRLLQVDFGTELISYKWKKDQVSALYP